MAYHGLPWPVRRPVHNHAAWLDDALRRSGYQLFLVWDELGVGRDCSVPIDCSFGDGRTYAGLPSQGFRLAGRAEVLENHGFTVGYSEHQRNPLWVAYRVYDVSSLQHAPRPSRFKVDARTRSQVRHDDYTGSGYDRGHMAPNFAMATRYGAAGQADSFLMSNVVPQPPGLNRHLWKDLEMRVALRYGRYFKEVWVITGPVFTSPVRRLDSGVAIPSAYYKIVVDEADGGLRAMAFLVDADCPPFTRPRQCLASIDRVEELTGLDFFPDLPEELQVELESHPASRLWPWWFSAIRYGLTGSGQ